MRLSTKESWEALEVESRAGSAVQWRYPRLSISTASSRISTSMVQESHHHSGYLFNLPKEASREQEKNQQLCVVAARMWARRVDALSDLYRALHRSSHQSVPRRSRSAPSLAGTPTTLISSPQAYWHGLADKLRISKTPGASCAQWDWGETLWMRCTGTAGCQRPS